ncbi:hypothetical protein WJ95_09350 [Burkholderia ubonensis]|nr:hypothetical protein WJ95_09350 [Burkholderia ubonensis]
MGGALGSAPTGLFSGLLPGGSMTGTASGALGGGISGAVNGAAPIGDATMGGFNFGNYSNLAQQLLRQSQQQRQQQQNVVQMPMQPNRFGGQRNPAAPIGPQMPYATFNQAQNGMAPGGPQMMNPFGLGGTVYG